MQVKHWKNVALVNKNHLSLKWNEYEKKTDTIVPVDPTAFAFEKAQEWLGGMIDKFNESVASEKKAEELARIESEIQQEVILNKVNFE